jgi:hypothetical protein
MDVLTGYLSFRALIKTPEEWRWFLNVFALLLVPYVMILAVESSTHRNLFKWVGSQEGIWLREGKTRCMGSFRHPSLLGSVGGCFFPLFVALIRERTNRTRGILGALLCLRIVGFSNSGGPLSVVMVSVVGWPSDLCAPKCRSFAEVWPLPRGLAMVMEAPSGTSLPE